MSAVKDFNQHFSGYTLQSYKKDSFFVFLAVDLGNAAQELVGELVSHEFRLDWQRTGRYKQGYSGQAL